MTTSSVNTNVPTDSTGSTESAVADDVQISNGPELKEHEDEILTHLLSLPEDKLSEEDKALLEQIQSGKLDGEEGSPNAEMKYMLLYTMILKYGEPSGQNGSSVKLGDFTFHEDYVGRMSDMITNLLTLMKEGEKSEFTAVFSQFFADFEKTDDQGDTVVSSLEALSSFFLSLPQAAQALFFDNDTPIADLKLHFESLDELLSDEDDSPPEWVTARQQEIATLLFEALYPEGKPLSADQDPLFNKIDSLAVERTLINNGEDLSKSIAGVLDVLKGEEADALLPSALEKLVDGLTMPLDEAEKTLLHMVILQVGFETADGCVIFRDFEFSSAMVEGMKQGVAESFKDPDFLAALLPIINQAATLHAGSDSDLLLSQIEILGSLISGLPPDVQSNLGLTASDGVNLELAVLELVEGGKHSSDRFDAAATVSSLLFKVLNGGTALVEPTLDANGNYINGGIPGNNQSATWFDMLKTGEVAYAFQMASDFYSTLEAGEYSNTAYKNALTFSFVLNPVLARGESGLITQDPAENSSDFLTEGSKAKLSPEDSAAYEGIMFLLQMAHGGNFEPLKLDAAQLELINQARLMFENGHVKQGMILLLHVVKPFFDAFEQRVSTDETLNRVIDCIKTYAQNNMPQSASPTSLSSQQEDAFANMIYALYGADKDPKDYDPYSVMITTDFSLEYTDEQKVAINNFFVSMGGSIMFPEVADDPTTAELTATDSTATDSTTTEETTTEETTPAAPVAQPTVGVLETLPGVIEGDPNLSNYPPPSDAGENMPIYDTINEGLSGNLKAEDGSGMTEEQMKEHKQALAYAQKLREKGFTDAALLIEANVALSMLQQTGQTSDYFPDLTLPASIKENGTLQLLKMASEDPANLAIISQIMLLMGGTMGFDEADIEDIQGKMQAYEYFKNIGDETAAEIMLIEIDMRALDALGAVSSDIGGLHKAMFDGIYSGIFQDRVREFVMDNGIYAGLRLKARMVENMLAIQMGAGDTSIHKYSANMKLLDEILNNYRQSLQVAIGG